MPYEIEMIWGDKSSGTTKRSDICDDLSKTINYAKEKYIEYTEDEDELNELADISVINEQNGLKVWSSNDEPALKAYMEYTDDEWHTIDRGHHEQSNEPSVYFDIDGTLGYWYVDGKGFSLDEILDPTNHYFRDIEPHEMMIALAERINETGIDVCVISAADKDSIRDKWEWIDEHLPFIPKENICFAPLGADKSEFVKGNADISILIDDYNKNLESWKGISIKAINTLNSHQFKFNEIDFTANELLIKNAKENSETFKEKIDEIVGQCSLEIEEIVETIKNQMELDYTKNKYHDYVEEWVAEHISPEILAKTQSFYETLEEGEFPSFKEYINEVGFADGSCFASFDEFCNNELPLIELADELEQFMFERGEYDYLTDTVSWIEQDKMENEVSTNREQTAKNIFNSLHEDTTSLSDYLKDEISILNNKDESLQVAKNLLNKIEEHLHSYVSDYGFENGAFDDFCDNELPLILEATNIEQFMFEHGEYDEPLDALRWVVCDEKNDFSPDREYTKKNILNDLDNKDLSALIEYFKNVVTKIDEPELITDACNILENLTAQSRETSQIKEEEKLGEECKTTDANSPALKGWQWNDYDDGSGVLQDASGKCMFQYDLATKEYKINGEWCHEDPIDKKEIKEFAEERFTKDIEKEKVQKKNKADIERD